ncbi:MAG: sugar phosphate isomerase/epimerase [Clostridia bacterium]|nr:sugar phosphate isomerase/epimerase [Clostridia bacterium]
MQIGLSTASFYGRRETEESAAHLRDWPLDFVEVFLETFSEYSPAFGQMVREALGDLPCRSVHVKGTQFEPDLFSASQRQQKDAMSLLEGAMQAAQLLGARYYVFHGPGVMHHDMKPLNISNVRERIPKIIELCRGYGVQFLWENVSWCTLRTPEDVRNVREAFPQVRFVLDLKQALRSGQDVFELLTAMGDRLCHLHVMDWDKEGKLCLPGEGVFDFARLRRELEKAGYQGGVLLEPYGQHTVDEDKVKKSLGYLREVFG